MTHAWSISLVVLLLLMPPVSAARAHDQLLNAVYLPLLQNGTSVDGPSTPPATNDDVRMDMVRQVNQARRTNGCPAATVNSHLMAGTQGWSTAMLRVGLMHSSGTWYDGYTYTSPVAEAIASGGTSMPDVTLIVHAWLNSPDHRNIVLWCPYGADYARYDIGVGLEQGYWTLGIGTVFT